MHIFGLFLVLAGTLLQVYVFARALSLPLFKNHLFRTSLLIAGIILWLALALGRTIGHSSTSIAATAVELAGMTWLASLFLISCCFLATDLVTGFGFLMRSHVPWMRSAALLCGLVFTIVAMAQGSQEPVIRRFEARIAGLPSSMEGKTIVAISDMHLGSTLGAGWLGSRVAQVQVLRPDMIVILGDLFEGHDRPASELLPQLRQLSAPLGVWAVPGNHESFGSQTVTGEFLQAAGIRMLVNEWQELRPGLVLAGVEDLTIRRYVPREGDPLQQTLHGRPQGVTILLSHSPLRVNEVEQSGVALMLSGHTHGGQIWPFNYLVQRMFPYMAGSYDIGRMKLIVSRGTGTWGPRMRLWYPGEILQIVLHG